MYVNMLEIENEDMIQLYSIQSKQKLCKQMNECVDFRSYLSLELKHWPLPDF